MAQSFFGDQVRVTNAGVRTIVYTSPLPNTQTVLHSIYIANNDVADMIATVEIGSGTFFSIARNVPIPAGSTLVFDKPITINPGDTLNVTADKINADVIISALQVTP